MNSSMILLVFRQRVLPIGAAEKVTFLAVSLDERWHYFIGQDCGPNTIDPTTTMAQLYLSPSDIIEVQDDVIDPLGAAFLLGKLGFPNKQDHDNTVRQAREMQLSAEEVKGRIGG